jgi:hypothetical protein
VAESSDETSIGEMAGLKSTQSEPIDDAIVSTASKAYQYVLLTPYLCALFALPVYIKYTNFNVTAHLSPILLTKESSEIRKLSRDTL